MSPQARGAAPKKASPQGRKKSQAAKAELNGAAPVAEFRGLKLRLPAKLPGSIAFDIFGLGQSEDQMSQLRFLNTVLGMEQLEKVRSKMDADGVDFDDALEFLRELSEAVFSAYGTGLGESPASVKSSQNAGT